MGIHSTLELKALQYAKEKIEKHYEDKFTYALPLWAMLTGNPTLIASVEVRGAEGVAMTKQRVEFNVSFKDKSSIIYYASYLNDHMNQNQETVGYIIFYDKNIYVKKDPNYTEDLSDYQNLELLQFNSDKSSTDISIIMLNNNYELVEYL